ncbi:MAG: GNAT family N-acetyltransferase [Pseudomonadota bacterium]
MPSRSALKGRITFRRLHRDDANGCKAAIRLWQRCGLADDRTIAAKDLQDCLSSGHGCVVLASPVESLVVSGTVMVGYDREGTGWVHYLAVAPSRQQQGIGAALLTMAEDILRAAGLTECRVMAHSPAIGGFYLAQGYHAAPVTNDQSDPPAKRIYVKRLIP